MNEKQVALSIGTLGFYVAAVILGVSGHYETVAVVVACIALMFAIGVWLVR